MKQDEGKADEAETACNGEKAEEHTWAELDWGAALSGGGKGARRWPLNWGPLIGTPSTPPIGGQPRKATWGNCLERKTKGGGKAGEAMLADAPDWGGSAGEAGEGEACEAAGETPSASAGNTAADKGEAGEGGCALLFNFVSIS